MNTKFIFVVIIGLILLVISVYAEDLVDVDVANIMNNCGNNTDNICPEYYTMCTVLCGVPDLDCADPMYGCPGSHTLSDISGIVFEQEAADSETMVESVGTTVELLDGYNTSISAYETTVTDASGYYEFVDILADVYNVRAIKDSYNPDMEFVNATVDNITDLYLYSDDSCDANCTRGDGRCHTDCSGIAGCDFDDEINDEGETAMEICDNQVDGWEKVFNDTHTILCCGGSPERIATLESLTPSPTSGPEQIHTFTRLISLKGKVVTMFVTLWED